MQLRTQTRIAILSALAFALMFVGEVPVPWIPGAKFDLSEIPAVLAALGMGPLAGLAVEVVKDLLFFLTGKSQAGWVGMAANLAAGGTLVLTVGLMNQWTGLGARAKELSGLQYWSRGVGAVVVGAAAMAAVMLVANAFFFIPLWTGQPGVNWGMSMGWVPFNLLKGGLAGVCGLALHRRLLPFVAGVSGRAA